MYTILNNPLIWVAASRSSTSSCSPSSSSSPPSSPASRKGFPLVSCKGPYRGWTQLLLHFFSHTLYTPPQKKSLMSRAYIFWVERKGTWLVQGVYTTAFRRKKLIATFLISFIHLWVMNNFSHKKSSQWLEVEELQTLKICWFSFKLINNGSISCRIMRWSDI